MKLLKFNTVATRLLLLSCVSAIVIVLGLVGFVKLSLIPQMRDQALSNQTNALAYSLKEIYKQPEQWQAAELAKQNKLLDAYSNDGKGVATLFLFRDGEYYRMATTLKKEDGTRAVGTVLQPDSAAAQALKANKPYVGQITLFQRPHMTTYLPISFTNGTRGSVFIGIDYESADPMVALSRQMDWLVIVVGLGSVLLLIVGFAYAIRIERAQREIDDIMRTTQEGLFLLDHRLRMGSQTSGSLSTVLGFDVAPGDDFLERLKPLVAPKTYTTAKEYIELLLRHDVKEKLVASLNPLDCIEISALKTNGQMESRFLQIRFNRVMKDQRVTHLLVTANDISRQVRLERELRDSEQRVQDQMGMMVHILQADPHALQELLQRVNSTLDEINEVMRLSDARTGLNNETIQEMQRNLHRLKGDAAALQMQTIAQSIHEFESVLQMINAGTDRHGEALVPITVRSKALYAEISSINEVIQRIGQIRNLVSVEPPRPEQDQRHADQPQIRQWKAFAQQLAERQHKQIELSYQGLRLDEIDANSREALNSIVNQFIRNALVHGVETPNARKQRGKTSHGHLSVYVSDQSDGTLELSFRDDGHGIDVDEIRTAAIRSGRLTGEQAAAMDQRQLTMLIFESGLSTRKTADEDAGRGIGLDSVRSQISRLGGRIRIGSTRGEYCHFRVTLPFQRLKTTATATLEPVHAD